MGRICVVLLLVLLCGLQSVSGQIATITGVVQREDNRIPLPYVNIWITGYSYGTSTNNDGVFEIKVPAVFTQGDHTISFSCLGYYSKRISLRQLVSGSPVTISLSSSVTKLSELVISSKKAKRKNANRARKLVQKALAQIPRNYPKHPYTLNTFYRHYCSENENYVRLIEAAMDVYSPKNDFDMNEIPDERLAFRITQLRRSFDFTKNAKIFHPAISLNFLWSNDLTAFEYHNPLAENLNNYRFSIIDTTNFDDKKVYVIDFSDSRTADQRPQTWYEGKLFIVKKSLAFIRAEVREQKRKNGIRDSVYSSIRKIVIYKPFENKYFLDRLSSDVNVYHASMDSNRVIIDTLRHKAHIEMIANNVVSGNSSPFTGREPRKVDLRKIKYDSTFWDQYTVLKETALEAKIIADLSRKISLEQQFQAFNTIDGGGISIIDSDRFKNLMSAHTGTPLYVVLWSNWGHLNYLDLEPVSYFKRMLKKERVKLLLVAVENDEDEWINNRKFYGLDNAYFEHERLHLEFDSEIAQSYLNNVFPYIISVSKEGKVLSQDPPLPNKEEIKPFIKSLIRDDWVAEH